MNKLHKTIVSHLQMLKDNPDKVLEVTPVNLENIQSIRQTYYMLARRHLDMPVTTFGDRKTSLKGKYSDYRRYQKFYVEISGR